MNDRMKKLFEECRQLAKDKNINVVTYHTQDGVFTVDGIDYQDGDKVKMKIIKPRLGFDGSLTNSDSNIDKLREAGVPEYAIPHIRLNAIALHLNNDIPAGVYLPNLLFRIERNHGNWLKFIETPRDNHLIYMARFMLYMNKAVYNAYLAYHSSEVAFNLTMGKSTRIAEVSELYSLEVGFKHRLLDSVAHIDYKTLQELVGWVLTDEPITFGTLKFIEVPVGFSLS